VHPTGLYNVLVMQVGDVRAFLDELHAHLGDEPARHLGHVLPVTDRFTFHDAADLSNRASRVALGWTAALAGRSFHTRMHRRGHHGDVHSNDVERAVDEALLAALAPAGRIDFADPDVVIGLETVRDEAGMALWTRDDLTRWPLLRHGLGLRAPEPPGTTLATTPP
jgi:tRNA(Ser,Leu) C12 N-acetylase TAN1